MQLSFQKVNVVGIVGLPIKNNKEYPLFDYERILFNKLFVNEPNPAHSFKNKHLWCKKSTGLGVSEFMLRIMGWLCTSTELYKNSINQMVIVTGPNQDLAIKLIKKLKAIFERKLSLTFQNKETVLELNGCQIEAYPSNHIDSFRSLTNPKFIFLDESDFWRKGEVEEVRHVAERYIAKSDPYIVMVSTPNAPNGLFDRIEREPEDTCLYKRVKLDYTYGLGKIYTEAEIENAKHSPSFKREYHLFYLGLEGNIFSPLQIERAVELGEKYKDLPINPYCVHSIGIDPWFSSSATAIVATEFLKEESKIKNVKLLIYKCDICNEALTQLPDNFEQLMKVKDEIDDSFESDHDKSTYEQGSKLLLCDYCKKEYLLPSYQ